MKSYTEEQIIYLKEHTQGQRIKVLDYIKKEGYFVLKLENDLELCFRFTQMD